MERPKISNEASSGCAALILAFVFMLLALKLLWAWTVPDLFPAAVEQGLVASELDWGSAAKLALFLALLAAILGLPRRLHERAVLAPQADSDGDDDGPGVV